MWLVSPRRVCSVACGPCDLHHWCTSHESSAISDQNVPSLAGVSEFRSCNLARIPARAVASRPGVELEDFKNFVLNIQNNSAFDPFNSTAYGAKDLLFRDNTVGLSDIGEKNTTELWLGKDYSGILKALDSCPVQISRGAVASPLELVALLLVGLLTVEGPTWCEHNTNNPDLADTFDPHPLPPPAFYFPRSRLRFGWDIWFQVYALSKFASRSCSSFSFILIRSKANTHSV